LTLDRLAHRRKEMKKQADHLAPCHSHVQIAPARGGVFEARSSAAAVGCSRLHCVKSGAQSSSQRLAGLLDSGTAVPYCSRGQPRPFPLSVPYCRHGQPRPLPLRFLTAVAVTSPYGSLLRPAGPFPLPFLTAVAASPDT
jgi:hypothetical protein